MNAFFQKIKNYLSIRRNRKKIIFLTVLIFTFLWLFWGIPLPTKLNSPDYPVSTKLFDRKGKLIYEIYTDKRRSPIKLEDLPEFVAEATISIEDKDFYKHPGFSTTGIVRAAYNTVFKRKLQGGSTLTQQLVKNVLLSPERTIKRKIREFVLTIFVETIYSKNQILEMYLNQIPYGSTAYGIESASELYFGKEAKSLSLAESALLTGLTAAPSKYSPFGAHPEMAKERQRTVLRRMTEDRYITQEEADKAFGEKLIFAQVSAPRAPHFALWIKEQLAEKYGEKLVEQGGLRVTTTLDLDLQNFAQDAVATEVAKLKKQKVGNGAVLVTRPKTGEILAMVGSKDYFAEDEDGKVNITLARRQPGSSIKPINYALALKDKKITLATALTDVPSCFSVAGQPLYCPGNYDGNFHGLVQARFALGNSYNIPAVKVLALNGIENFVNFANQMGISTFIDPNQYGLSLTLGGGEVRPYDMAIAFGVFANQGIKQPLISILKVTDWKGKTLEEIDVNEVELNGERVLPPDVTFLISHILLDNNARSQAFGESSFLNVRGHPEVSVKTGTTNDRRDNWTIGYTGLATVVAWVGNNDNTSMGGAVSGVSGASPIWNMVIKEVLNKAEDGFYSKEDDGHVWPNQPDQIIGKSICATTGLLPSGDQADCPMRFEYFLNGTIPEKRGGERQDIQIDKTNGQVAPSDLAPEFVETQNHPVYVDPLGTIYCLDCPIASRSATIRYPL
ncbi:MAG: transglycosylase domain-containing protein [bacterium]|nr:transglycosylase domain-containing protein [bacterium]